MVVIQHRTPGKRAAGNDRRGRVKLILAGCVAAMAVFVLNVTLAVLTILVLGGTAAGLTLFRGRSSSRLGRFLVGAMLGTTLYIIFAWYGTATSQAVLQAG